MLQRLTGAILTTLVLAQWNAAAMAQAPFYAGKTITIIAGTKAGDVYDTYARLFAEHLPKYIPGNPNIIVQNMPGAGSMRYLPSKENHHGFQPAPRQLTY
jgi:tripartite-type tricarboxylate transporter receptor subunit TctC